MRSLGRYLLYEGACYSVYFHEDERARSDVYDHYAACDDVTRASLLFLVKKLGDGGRIYDTTRFRIEDRKNRIFCFKARDERFFCFFLSGRVVVVVSAYRKKRQKMDVPALKKAVMIKKLYMEDIGE